MKLGGISHPDPIVDEKVKFFYDIFHYWLTKSALRWDMYPENHLSILEKIYFRSNELDLCRDSTKKVVSYLLASPEFDVKKDIYSRKGEIKVKVQALKTLSGAKEVNALGVKKAVEDIVSLLNENQGFSGYYYFDSNLEKLIVMLACEDKLEVHKDEIILRSRWLIAEFLRRGYEISELVGHNGVFAKILEFRKLITPETSKKSSFPLPNNFDAIKDKDEFDRTVLKMFSADSFRSQFKGLLYELQKEFEGYFLFKVDKIRSVNEQSEFRYYDVEIISLKRALEIDEALINSFGFKDGFDSSRALVVKVNIKFKSMHGGIARAKILAQDALNAFRYLSGDYEGGTIDFDKVYYSNNQNKGNSFSSNSWLNYPPNNKDEGFIKVELPVIHSLEMENYLLRCDNIFFRSLSYRNGDEKISAFWQYWESALNEEVYPEGKGKKAEEIINFLSKVMADGEKRLSEDDALIAVFNYAMNNQWNIDGIPSNLYERYANRLNWADIIDIVKEVQHSVKYPFLNFLCDKFLLEVSNGKSSYKKGVPKYKLYFWQLYEQRNFIQHKGHYCKLTLQRLDALHVVVVNYWRSTLFNEIDKDPTVPPKEAVARIFSSYVK